MHRTRIPSLALALVLQVVPVCRVVTTNAAIATPTFALIARCAAAIAALLGAVDSVSGASIAVTVAGVQSVLPPLPGVKTNITGKVGSPMVLRIVLAGTVGQQPQLDYYNATPLPPGLTINTNINTNSVGLASTNYYIYGTPTAAGVWYPVTVSAGNLLYPTVTSTNILITITNAGGTSPPAFTTQPQSRTVTNGGSVTFSAAASGSPSYQWRKNGANLAGANTATFTIAAASTNDAGSYTVIASNAGGSVTSVVATLTVLVPPRIVTPPQSLTVAAGETATFQVVADGSPSPSYQWRFNSAAIPGQTGSSLVIANAQTANEGDYTVEVANAAGQVTSAIAHLSIQAPPEFTTQPQSLTITNGGSANFTVIATGSPTFQWQKNGTNLDGATTSTLAIAAASTNDAGSYTVIASNAGGSVTSIVATLTVLVPPRIVTSPRNLTIALGGTATFEVLAEGWPAPSYQWQFNNSALAGQTSPSLIIADVQSANEGDYTVIVSSSAGSVTSSTAHLTVEVPSGPITLSNLQLAPEGAGFDISSPAGVPIVIWASTDLSTWLPIHTNANPTALWHFVDPSATSTGSRFYRAQR